MSPLRITRLYLTLFALASAVALALVALNVGGLRHDPTGTPGAVAAFALIVALTGLVVVNRKARK